MNQIPQKIPLPNPWIDAPIRVHLVGAGGTGSQVADQLASLQATMMALGHPGFRVTVHDPDRVSDANIGRQRFCQADIGHPKANVLVHRINMFHGLSWEAEPSYFDPIQFGSPLVIGCVDSVKARKTIARSNGWWLDCGNSDHSGHVILGCNRSGHEGGFRVPTWLDLFPGTQEDTDAPSCSVEEALMRQSWPVNHRAAQIAMELLYQWMREGFLAWHGALFTVCPPSITPLPIQLETWLPFGWRPKKTAA